MDEKQKKAVASLLIKGRGYRFNITKYAELPECLQGLFFKQSTKPKEFHSEIYYWNGMGWHYLYCSEKIYEEVVAIYRELNPQKVAKNDSVQNKFEWA